MNLPFDFPVLFWGREESNTGAQSSAQVDGARGREAIDGDISCLS